MLCGWCTNQSHLYKTMSTIRFYLYHACIVLTLINFIINNQEIFQTISSIYCISPLTPNDHYSGCTAPLTSKRCILYIYSTNIGTEYFKHGIYCPFLFSSKCSLFHNSNIFGSCFIQILYTGCAKILKNNSGAKRLIQGESILHCKFVYVYL